MSRLRLQRLRLSLSQAGQRPEAGDAPGKRLLSIDLVFTMTTKTPELTAAATLAGSPVIQDSIDAIVRELTDAQSLITGARPPQKELTETFQNYLDRVARTKGKPPLYPYVGSGVGNGPLVELADGSVKWDMITGIGVHPFGHSDPDLVATALRAALGDTVQQGNLQFNADSIEFSELLLAEASRASRLRHCFTTNSGVMANESALKICYQKNAPASRVIAFSDCFMGRSVTMSQIGDNPAGRVGIPLTTQVDYMPFYDAQLGAQSTQRAIAQLQQHIARYPGQHACFVMELVQGEGGFNIAPPEFFIALMKMCRQHNIAVWVDEIQTFGRTNSMFHFEQLGLGEYIDVVTIGKMAQACACLFTEEFNPKPGLLSGTFIGGTVELLSGEEALDLPRLNSLFDGVGGMMRLTPFGGEKAMVTKALNVMFAEGVIAFYCGHGPYHIRFLPPIGVMQPQQFNDVFAIMEIAFAKVVKE